jgi:hypothetical protein
MVSPRQTHEVCGACPLDRPDGCSWVVTVEDGVPTRLRGAVEHPFSRGSLCNKVAGYLEHTRAPGPLLYPLRRVGRTGEGRDVDLFHRVGGAVNENASDDVAHSAPVDLPPKRRRTPWLAL